MHNSSLLRSLVSKLQLLLKGLSISHITSLSSWISLVLYFELAALFYYTSETNAKTWVPFSPKYKMKQPCQNVILPTLVSTTGQRSLSSIRSRAPSDQQQTSCRKRLVIMTLSKKRPGYAGTKSDGYQLRITKWSKKGGKSAMVLSPLHQTIQAPKT